MKRITWTASRKPNVLRDAVMPVRRLRGRLGGSADPGGRVRWLCCWRHARSTVIRRVLRGQGCRASNRWRSVGTPAPVRVSSSAGRPVSDMARASLVPVTGAPLPLLHVVSLACSCSPSRRPRGRKPAARAGRGQEVQDAGPVLHGWAGGDAEWDGASRMWMQESVNGPWAPTPGDDRVTWLRSSRCCPRLRTGRVPYARASRAEVTPARPRSRATSSKNRRKPSSKDMTRWPRTSRHVHSVHRLGVPSRSSSSWAKSRAITRRLAVVRRCTSSGMASTISGFPAELQPPRLSTSSLPFGTTKG